MKNRMKLIGVGGLPRSGKDSLAELFIQFGYFGISLGDLVRGFARERHKDTPDPISVANMTETSNWLRERQGVDVFLQEALHQFNEHRSNGKKDKGLVLWSIRVPLEVDWILNHGGELIWIDANDAVRHQRHLKHLREGELPISLQEFKKQEALQWQPQPGLAKEAQMDISYVKSRATKLLTNNGDDIEAFKAEAEKALSHLLN